LRLGLLLVFKSFGPLSKNQEYSARTRQQKESQRKSNTRDIMLPSVEGAYLQIKEFKSGKWKNRRGTARHSSGHKQGMTQVQTEETYKAGTPSNQENPSGRYASNAGS